MTIFVVEDDAAIFALLKERLEKWSLRVAGPANFHDIIGPFLNEQPQLVILDIQLPKYDGFHWCREIRAISKVPIIFHSSRDHPLDMVMAMNMGRMIIFKSRSILMCWSLKFRLFSVARMHMAKSRPILSNGMAHLSI